MNPALRTIIGAFVGLVTFFIVLRLFLVPTYAFTHSGSGPLMPVLMILEAALSLFIACRVVCSMYKYL